MKVTLEQIAQVCHEANSTFCLTLGDHSQAAWDDAPAWQKESAIKGVMFRIENPNAPISAQHESWVEEKVQDGWVYGPVKDVEKKTHPCIVPYELLPLEQRLKDHLFVGIVKALTQV